MSDIQGKGERSQGFQDSTLGGQRDGTIHQDRNCRKWTDLDAKIMN